jgi:hypothetical protein
MMKESVLFPPQVTTENNDENLPEFRGFPEWVLPIRAKKKKFFFLNDHRIHFIHLKMQ